MKRKTEETELDHPHGARKRVCLEQDNDQVVSESSQGVEKVFIHLPLSTSQDAIRLIKIKSVDRWGTILCEIDHYRASKCPDYIAISYCWGIDSDSFMIRLNGRAFQVRKNLWLLLQTLGPLLKNQHLWIDAVYIDQTSTKERNHQVRMMGQIYAGAREVIAWLGVMDEDSKKTFDYLRCVTRYNRSRTRADAATCLNLQNLETLLSLRRFLERDYWYRTWIIQEILLARSVRLICGNEEVKWSSLQDLQGLWHEAEFPGSERAQILDMHDCMIFQIMGQRQNVKTEHLNLLVIRYRYSECQDPRNKVYSLLALAADFDDGSTLDVDYDKSLGHVFCDVLSFCENLQPDLRMHFAEVLRDVLGLAMEDIQAFVPHETTFTWESLRVLDRRGSDQNNVLANSSNRPQEYEGLFMGEISSVSAAYGQGDSQACWAFDGSRVPDLDTRFELAGIQQRRFTFGGFVPLHYWNLSFASIATGDLVYQVGTLSMALVFRHIGTDTGHLIAVARTGNIMRASTNDSRIKRRTFWLSPSDVLGLNLNFQFSFNRLNQNRLLRAT